MKSYLGFTRGPKDQMRASIGRDQWMKDHFRYKQGDPQSTLEAMTVSTRGLIREHMATMASRQALSTTKAAAKKWLVSALATCDRSSHEDMVFQVPGPRGDIDVVLDSSGRLGGLNQWGGWFHSRWAKLLEAGDVTSPSSRPQFADLVGALGSNSALRNVVADGALDVLEKVSALILEEEVARQLLQGTQVPTRLPRLQGLKRKATIDIATKQEALELRKSAGKASNKDVVLLANLEMDPKNLHLLAVVKLNLYLEMATKTFEGAKGVVWMAMDASLHAGDDTSVVVAVWEGKACYPAVQILPPLQWVHPDMGVELEEGTIAVINQQKEQRKSTFHHIRALQGHLKSIGLSLEPFATSDAANCLPPGQGEVRVVMDNRVLLVNPGTKTYKVCLDFSRPQQDYHVLHITSDQGSPQTAMAAFLASARGGKLNLISTPDPYHRIWNDIKLALKRTLAYQWSSMLQGVLAFNMAYGPFMSGHHKTQREKLLEFFAHSVSPQDSELVSMAPLLAEFLECAPEQVHSTICKMDASNKGTFAKLSRWWGAQCFATLGTNLAKSADCWHSQRISLQGHRNYYQGPL